MATHTEKLSTSLEILKGLVGESKRAIFKSREFSRVHKERLVKAGFLIPDYQRFSVKTRSLFGIGGVLRET